MRYPPCHEVERRLLRLLPTLQRRQQLASPERLDPLHSVAMPAAPATGPSGANPTLPSPAGNLANATARRASLATAILAVKPRAAARAALPAVAPGRAARASASPGGAGTQPEAEPVAATAAVVQGKA